MKQFLCFLNIFFTLFILISCSQENNKFHQLDTNHFITNEISNQQITCFAEDNLGQIWIGTFRGLNKYYPNECHQYYNTNDSLSLPDNQVRDLLCDSNERLWVATVNGVCRYSNQDNWERIKIEANNQYAYQLLESQDKRIFMRMGKEIGLYIPEEKLFRSVISYLNDSVNNTYILKCFIDKKNNLWVIHSNIIRCYDSNSLKLKKTFNTKGYIIQNAFMCQSEKLWLTSHGNLLVLDTQLLDYVELPEIIRDHSKLSNTIIEDIHTYNSNSILFNTQIGFFIYNYTENKLIYQDETAFPFDPPQFKVTALFADSQDNLWIGSSDQGFFTHYHYKNQFNNNNDLRTFFANRSVISLMEDNCNQLWITTAQNGLFIYDRTQETISEIETKYLFPEVEQSSNQVKSVFLESNNNIWLVGNNKLIKCNYNNQKNILKQENVYWLEMLKSELAEDRTGTIWAATHGQNIYALRRGSTEFEELPLFPPGFTFTNTIKTLSTGDILVCAFPYNPRLINPDTWEVTELDVSPCIKRSQFIPTCLYEDKNENVWIGTITNGLLRYSLKQQIFERVEGTSCTDISSIQEDKYGNIWISTLYGLSRYNPNLKNLTNYYKSDGIGGNQFNERASFHLKDGTIAFGATHGITFFKSSNTLYKRTIPLLFTKLKVGNQLIHPFRSNCINRNLTYNPEICLNHKQNSFTISFTALDYSEYERVHYNYMLECFDRQWMNAQNSNEAHYSNLPTGKYTFKVRIRNSDNTITETESAIRIIVKPAPWATWWAYILYLTIILLKFRI